MIVTRVEAVTKTKYKVYVDGQFAFILYKGELSRFHIAEDQELSQESYEKIRTEVILKRAKLRAMHLLNDMCVQRRSLGRNLRVMNIRQISWRLQSVM